MTSWRCPPSLIDHSLLAPTLTDRELEEGCRLAREIAEIVEAAHKRSALVKVVFENCYLADEYKIELSSTGFGSGGATIEDSECDAASGNRAFRPLNRSRVFRK